MRLCTCIGFAAAWPSDSGPNRTVVVCAYLQQRTCDADADADALYCNHAAAWARSNQARPGQVAVPDVWNPWPPTCCIVLC